MILALILSAHADPIRTTQLPQSFTYSFDYPTVPGAVGQTLFTFDTAVRDTSTIVCSDLPGCMDGTFFTGNGGEGVFTTDLSLVNCTAAPPPSMPTTGFNFVPQTCDVEQSLDLLYDVTGTNYLGAALCGSVTVDVVYACAGPPFNACLPDPAGFINRTYTFAPEPMSGTIEGVFFGSTVFGTFEEL